MNDITSVSTEGRKQSQPGTRKVSWYRSLLRVLLPACVVLVVSFFNGHPVICPRPHLYLGPKLTWRSYFWYGLERWNYWAATGQMDQDTDEELLLGTRDMARVNPPQKPFVVFNVDGKRKRAALRMPEYGDGLGRWDYNGDGKDDILSSNYDFCSIFDLDGMKLATLKGGLRNSANAVGCFALNQAPQLVLSDWSANGESIRCYSQNSTEAKAFNPNQGFEEVEVLDLDHDGISEILGKERGQGEEETWIQLRAGKSDKRYTLPKLGVNGGFLQVSAAGDIGYFYKSHSYVNLRTGKKMHLAYPPKQWKDEWDWSSFQFSIASGDFLGTGELQFAVASGGTTKTAILLFSSSGKCLYYQDMGCAISWLTRLHANGRDHLVALAEERVFIYP
jgi:hypothetical protein